VRERVALRLFITQHISTNNQVLSSRHLHQTNVQDRSQLLSEQTLPPIPTYIVGGRVLAVAETSSLGVTGVVRLLEKNGETRMETPANQRILISGDTLEDEGDPIATDSSQDGNSWQQGNFSYG